MFPTKIFDLSQRRSGDRRHAATKALRLGQVAMRFSLTFPTSYALLACACLVFGFRLAARRTSDVQTLAETESCDEEVKEVLTEESDGDLAAIKAKAHEPCKLVRHSFQMWLGAHECHRYWWCERI